MLISADCCLSQSAQVRLWAVHHVKLTGYQSLFSRSQRSDVYSTNAGTNAYAQKTPSVDGVIRCRSQLPNHTSPMTDVDWNMVQRSHSRKSLLNMVGADSKNFCS